MIINPYRYGGGAPPPPAYTTANLVAMLDAADIASWSGSGAWANIVAAPADGAAQTDYDFNPAAGGNAPTFNGTPGAGTSAEFWGLDGADYFSRPGVAADLTAFLKALHKAGSQFTLEFWMLWAGVQGTGICPVFDSGTSDQGGGDVSRGVTYTDLGNAVTNRGHSVRVMRDSGGAAALSVKADAAIASAAVVQLACSIDGTGGDASFLYKNGAYDQVGASDTWDGTFASPGTADPVNVSRLGCRGDTVQFVPSGTRFYLARLYNTNLTKAQLDTNWDATRGRFGL